MGINIFVHYKKYHYIKQWLFKKTHWIENYKTVYTLYKHMDCFKMLSIKIELSHSLFVKMNFASANEGEARTLCKMVYMFLKNV